MRQRKAVVGKIDYAAFEGLEVFSALPAALHFQLFPDRRYLERGLLYYAEERVHSLRWEAGTQRLRAKVRGSGRDYDIHLQVAGDSLLHRCGCPAWEASIGCKHLVATYALVMHLFQDRRLFHRFPSFGYLQSTLVEFLETAPVREAKAPERKEVLTSTIRMWIDDESGRLYFSANDRLGIVLLQDGGFQREFVGWGWAREEVNTDARFRHYHVDEALPALATQCDAHGVELCFVDDSEYQGVQTVVRPGVARLPFRAILDWVGDEIELELIPANATPDYFNLWCDPGRQLFLDAPGRLLMPEPGPALHWIKCFNDAVYGSFAFGGRRNHRNVLSVGADVFNDVAFGFDLAPVHCTSDALTVALDGTPQSLVPESVASRLVLSVEPEESGSGAFCATPYLEVDGVLVDAVALLRELADDLAGKYHDRKLWGAKGRAARLSDALHNLFLLGSKSERSACIAEAVADPLFKRMKLTTQARSCLRAVQKNWVECETSSVVLALGEEDPRWVLANVPRRAIARFALALWGIRDRRDLEAFGGPIRCRSDDLAVFLTEALALAEATGAEVRFEGAPPRHVPVEIDIHAEESERLDWFELKAEVRCESMVLSDQYWHALISGNLLMKGKDGKLVVPNLGPHREVLDRLRTLAGGGSGGSESTAVSRLQILDWLELRRHGATVHLPPAADSLFRSLQEFAEVPARSLPEGLNAQLRDYQHRGFDWLEFLYDHRFGACLADDMGLGKTLQAITFLAARTPVDTGGTERASSHRPHLIVVPPSLLFNWQSEIERFCPRLRVAEYAGSQRDWAVARTAPIVITTYDILRLDQEAIVEQPFDIVIFDETQVLKNVATARAKAARKIERRFTLCLTGTPMENHLGEYHAIIDLAVPGLFGSAREFRQAVKDGGGERLLRRAQPFILRRTKERILDELPPKVESDLYLDMTAEQKELYTRTVGEVREEVLAAYADKPRQQAGIVALSALLRLRQVCISPALIGVASGPLAPKFEHLLETLQELRDEGHAALIFSQFTKSLDVLEAECARRGHPCVRLDGSMTAAKRKQAVRTFQESETSHAFLISLKAGGTGLNLTRASYVFHLDPWWNPAVEHQASDRAHRIGQRRTVFVQRLLMRHTVEEKIQKLKARKQALFDAIVENPAATRKTSQPLSRDDFEFLLEG